MPLQSAEISYDPVDTKVNIGLCGNCEVISMEKVERGDTIRITAIFTDPDTGELVDPENPSCDIFAPDDTVKHSGAMSKLGTGSYRAECQTEFDDDIGYWTVRCYGTYNSKRAAQVERIKIVEVI